MEELVQSLKASLADSYAFALKCQNYHWNVESHSFAEYHKFFGELYSEVSDGVDGIAENIRTLSVYVPASFSRFKELTSIQDETKVPSAEIMLSNLERDNQIVLKSLTNCYEQAEKQKKFAISNFIQDRLTAHEKHGWMLKSFKD